MIGAIPGGVDVERTYHLMDMYIQECEQLQTLKEINDLQYQMLFDFCEKAGETHIPSGISADIYACMNYIRSHTNEAIRLEDVAAHIDRSTSFIAKKYFYGRKSDRNKQLSLLFQSGPLSDCF